MLKIRLQRTGRKKQPFYRVVVTEHASAAKGKFIEKLGYYNPLEKPWRLEVDTDKVLEWIKKGAKPSNTVARLLKSAGVEGMEPYIVEMKDRKAKKQEEEKPEEKLAEGGAEAPAEEKVELDQGKTTAPTEEEKAEEEPAVESKEEEKAGTPDEEGGEKVA